MIGPANPNATLSFLGRLACGAPGNVLEASWTEAVREDGGAQVRRLAARLGLQGAASLFVAGLPKRAITAHVRHLVADGLRAAAHSEGAIDLLRALVDRSEANGIEAIVIKGAALRLSGLYSEGERDAVDADIVVPVLALPSLREAAVAAGLAWQDMAPGGHEAAVVRGDGAMLEVHSTLAGDAGREPGLDWERIRPLAAPAGAEWPRTLLLLRGHAAREVTVQHFVRHHGGEPAHALRALQDLSRLESEEDARGLLWPRDAVGLRRAVARLRGVSRALREAPKAELPDDGASFLERLATALSALREPNADYSAGIDRWLALQVGLSGRLALVARSLRSAPGGETGAARLTRPLRMLRRYLAGRASRVSGKSATRLAADWSRDLERE